MLFLLIPPDSLYVRDGFQWKRLYKDVRKVLFSNQDVICGFYRQDFYAFYHKKVNFFELGHYFDHTEDPQVLQEFIDLCVQEGLLQEDGGRINRIAFSMGLLRSYAGDLLFKDDPKPWEELSYHGGRTEAFTESAKGQIVYYDINSAYAYAMVQPLPDRTKAKEVRARTLTEVLKLHKEGYVVSFGRAYVMDYLPPLPIKVQDRTFYPVGYLQGWWTGFDLELLSLCDQSFFYPEKTVFFPRKEHKGLKDLVLELYGRRKESKSKAERVFLKHALVQLYGLIAWKQKGMPKNRLVGGFITAFVRSLHYKAMRKVQDFGKLIYCDTDAFFLESSRHEKIKEVLTFGKDLGQWGVRGRYVSWQGLGYKRYLARDEDGKEHVVYSGDRAEVLGQSLYHVSPYDGSIRRIDPSPQDLPPRKVLEDGSTYPWFVDELYAVAHEPSSL